MTIFRSKHPKLNKTMISKYAFGRSFYPNKKKEENFPKLKSPIMSPRDYFFNALRTGEFKREQNKIPFVSFGKTYRPEREFRKHSK